MVNGLTKCLRFIRSLEKWLEQSNRLESGVPLQILFFLYLKLALILLRTLAFILELPVHLTRHPTASFVLLAARRPSGEFLDSYYRHYQRYQIAVASALLFTIVTALQLYVIGVGYYKIGQPTKVSAYSTTVSLSPIWDRTGFMDEYYNNFVCPQLTTFDCEAATSATLSVGRQETGDAVNCDVGTTGHRLYNRTAIKFDLSSIPDNAAITDVDLIINVSTATVETIEIFRADVGGANPDNPDPATNGQVSCTVGGSSLYQKLAASANYATASNWNVTGSKTYDLGSTADTELDSRLTTSDIFSIGLRVASPVTLGKADAVDSANDPQLSVTYTLPPQAPSDPSHSANSTSSITWTWVDNATAETRYDVHDASQANVAGCINLAANSQSCTETGLAANTQYTRHPNVTDADGNTDGPSSSAYTSIETPPGLTFPGVTSSSITGAASGTISNLTSGSAGLFFQETVTATNSGWTQTNSWTKSGLTANTQYSFQAKARNGDADETSLTPASTKYTLAAAPNVSSDRSISTFYTANPFSFTNAAGWGGGGVQYYRYVWDQSSTHTFNSSENTWADAQANCPGGACADAGLILNKNATANGRWYLHVQSFNGENAANGGGTTYGPYFFDAAGPAFSNIAVSVTTASAIITWTTDETASSQAEYGLTGAYGTTTASNPTLVTSHQVVIGSLAPGTTYHYRVISTDAAGNTSRSADQTFATASDPAAPEKPVAPSVRLLTPTMVSPGPGALVMTSRPVFTGNALSGNTIFLFLDGGLEKVFKTSDHPSGVGSYAYRLERALGGGYHTYYLKARDDTSGKTSRYTSVRTFITFPDVPPTIVAPAKDEVLSQNHPTVTGLAWSNYDALVFLDGELVGVTRANAGRGGVGDFALTVGPLDPGEHTIHIRIRGPDGQIGLATRLRTFTIPDGPT